MMLREIIQDLRVEKNNTFELQTRLLEILMMINLDCQFNGIWNHHRKIMRKIHENVSRWG